MSGRNLGLTFVLILGIIMGILTTKLMSAATAEEKTADLKLFQPIGTHREGDNSVFNVYCDRERRNLIYSYIVVAGTSPSSNLVVLKDSCK
jgi:hypothetical protein